MQASRDDRIIFGKSAHEYFRELVTDALSHRSFKIQEATEFYLVNLLARFLEKSQLFAERSDGTVEIEPLALVLLQALQGGRLRRFQGLKKIGDTSLFLSGFFGDSLSHSAVDIGYYIAMGERAYDALSEGTLAPAGTGDLYGELAQRFEQFVDVFAEIAELSDLRSNRGLVRLYERFLTTGSQRVAERLQERGVALFAGPGTKGLKH